MISPRHYRGGLVAAVVLAALVISGAANANAQVALTFGGRHWSITIWAPTPPPCGGGWYSPSCPLGQQYWTPHPIPSRGSYSIDWDERTGQWSEYESARTPDGRRYRRSTNCSPQWGCETTVTTTTRSPYRPPPRVFGPGDGF